MRGILARLLPRRMRWWLAGLTADERRKLFGEWKP